MTVIVILNLVLIGVLAGIATLLARTTVYSSGRAAAPSTRPHPRRSRNRTDSAQCSGDVQRERPRLTLVYSADAEPAVERR
jgi:hypothetical protein